MRSRTRYLQQLTASFTTGLIFLTRNDLQMLALLGPTGALKYSPPHPTQKKQKKKERKSNNNIKLNWIIKLDTQ